MRREKLDRRTGIGNAALDGEKIGHVWKLAVFSRVLILSLFLLWKIIAWPYDTSSTLNPPCLVVTERTAGAVADNEVPVKWKVLGDAIEKVIVWDGVYYVRIAECGYEYEQTHAFFPALPLLTRLLANTVLNILVPLLGYRATLTICGYFITNVAFVYAAIYLYKLTLYVVEEEDHAWRAVCLFCFNPASVFYSSIYSESLFALCSFAGLRQFVSGRTWIAAFLFGVSSGVRSNGVLHAGFFLFQAMHCAYKETTEQGKFLRGVLTIIKAVSQCLVTVAPLIAFQAFGYLQYCGLSLKGSEETLRPWCNATIPYLYGFVQSHYWEVGLFRYFQVKQIPNFLLASPALFLAVAALVSYGRHQPYLLFFLGFKIPTAQWWKLALLPEKRVMQKQVNMRELGELDEVPGLSALSPEELRQRRGSKVEFTSPNKPVDDNLNSLGGFYSPAAVCFLVQLAVMVFVASCIMHVQVATRFLSVSPPIYWYAAHALETRVHKMTVGGIIWTYFLSFLGLGSLLFINFYPFT